jgi:hypothetical protein
MKQKRKELVKRYHKLCDEFGEQPLTNRKVMSLEQDINVIKDHIQQHYSMVSEFCEKLKKFLEKL